ncbi:MAG: polysaccharide deacetylase family protein [bacterium]|nr:polysaccharide deacetylase family protein [bacterium]
MKIKIKNIALCFLLFPGFLAADLPGREPELQKKPGIRRVAFTIDDLPFVAPADSDMGTLKKKTALLLKKLTSNNIPAVGFVNAGKLFPNSRRDERQVELLRMWLDAGLEIGNHTYSHNSLNKNPLSTFREDVIKGETIIKELLEKKGMKLRYFRHPYLHTGRTLEIKAAAEAFLSKRRYTIAPVTIDNADWIFSRAYDKAAARKDKALMKQIADAFIPYMEQKFAYFEKQSVQLFGYQANHILLLHANTLNADNLGRLVRMLKKRGYTFITLEQALTDKVYRSPDTFTGAGGITWLHRWAITMGKKGSFFSGEPRAPEFVKKEAGVTSE